MDCLASRSLLVVLILNLAVACGPRLRTCDHPDGCGEGAYCDEPSQVCILLLEDGGRWVDPDAGPPSVPNDGPADAGTACNPGDTLPCTFGCGAVQRCLPDGTWGVCEGFGCGPGLECVQDVCRCTVKKCAGCCASPFSCMPGTGAAACGHGGATCSACSATTSCRDSTLGNGSFECRP